MSQKELLDQITTTPGIYQTDIVAKYGVGHKSGGSDSKMLLQLVKKKCITRKATGKTYALYPTGEPL
jgi:hypothetical protein